MANGDPCKVCGYQETIHEFEPKLTCEIYQGTQKHHSYCSIIGCDGDCRQFRRKQEEEAKRAYNRLMHAWFVDGPEIISLDIGS